MQATVTRIVKDFSFTNRWPVAWLALSCGHTHKGDYDYMKSAHDDANHKIKPGEVVDCSWCDQQARAMQQLRDTPREQLSHSRFRHDDSRGFGPGRHYIYQRDDGPTRCRLLLSLDDTPESVALIRECLGTSSISPTEKR